MELGHYLNRRDCVILALPRGGVPVGCELSRALHLPLDVLIVRKLGVPDHEELAMGAIASGGVKLISTNIVSAYRGALRVLRALRWGHQTLRTAGRFGDVG